MYGTYVERLEAVRVTLTSCTKETSDIITKDGTHVVSTATVSDIRIDYWADPEYDLLHEAGSLENLLVLCSQ